MPFRRKHKPTFSQIQSIFSLIRKLFVKKSEILTSHLQRKAHFAVLVGGAFRRKKSLPALSSAALLWYNLFWTILEICEKFSRR